MRYLHCTMIFLIRNSHFDLYYLYSNTNGNIGDDPDEILSRAYTFDEYINNKDKVDECQECFARNVCSSCLGSFEIKSDKVQISNPIYCESIKVATKRALQRLSDIKKNPKTWEEFNRFLDKGYEERR